MHRLVRAQLEEQFADKAVMPQLHIPQQRAGRIDVVPLFPNPAFPRPVPVKDKPAALTEFWLKNRDKITEGILWMTEENMRSFELAHPGFMALMEG
jgi:hypothetical protein